MKSNIAFIDKSMERAGQYCSKANAKAHASLMPNRKHKIVDSICYRMDGDDVTEYRCYVPVLL
jgi:hypothetical protein